MMKNINQTAETPQNKSASKKANIAKTAAAAALITITGATHGQNSATIDPKNYSIANPFIIPNLPNISQFNLIIKAGEKVPVTIDNMDINGTTDIRGPPQINEINNIQNNTVYFDRVGTWTRYYKKTDGTINHIGINVNYQEDIYDRTPGSSTQNQRPEVVMVDAGQQATLSAGPNMNPTGGTNGYYKWKNINDASFTGDYTDSTRVVGNGTYISRTNDGTGTWTNDTIAVIERPSANNSARTLDFATTVSGVNYKVYKFQPAAAGAPMSKAPSESAVDSAWVEVPSLSFVGDGNPRSVGVELGTYRIGAQRTPNTDVQQDTKSIKVDLGTDVLEVNTEEKNTFKQANRELSRETEVPSIIYDIHGREMGTALASTIRIPDQATAGVYIVRFTENGKIHTKKIIVR